MCGSVSFFLYFYGAYGHISNGTQAIPGRNEKMKTQGGREDKHTPTGFSHQTSPWLPYDDCRLLHENSNRNWWVQSTTRRRGAAL